MNERKRAILDAIIHAYMTSPTPVGSRTVSKDLDLGISSATVRNEMSDLEEAGYLVKPHTSAGRIPSQRAFRDYVDTYLQVALENHRSFVDFSEFGDHPPGSSGFYLEATNYLAQTTGNIAYILAPTKGDRVLRYLDLIPLEPGLVLLLIVGDRGNVSKELVRVPTDLDVGELDFIRRKVSDALLGVNFEAVAGIKMKLVGNMIRYQPLIVALLKFASTVATRIQEVDVFTGGITNFLELEEYQDLISLKSLMDYASEKENILRISEDLPEELSVRIGTENGDEVLHGASMVSGTYRVGNATGRVGILGPLRMDYLSVAKVVQSFTQELTGQLGMQ
ncbi:MAG: heat-inducible transcriptional repressor HrcA [Tissierellia bacterium]|nr:heat-inducible transcriptional repressor HrcA [Tissierellia bacterium]